MDSPPVNPLALGLLFLFSMSDEVAKWVMGLVAVLLIWALRQVKAGYDKRLESLEKHARGLRRSIDFLRRHTYVARKCTTEAERLAHLDTIQVFIDRWRTDAFPDGVEYRGKEYREERGEE